MRNRYSLIMNLNAINKTWALVNKNSQFSNTRKPELIEAFKLVKITFKMLKCLCARKCEKRK